ncbi:MAG: alanine--tRNA ligase [Acidiferrobacterales bacterium]|nr:alanine--tRNA ligase [Acidiferrobacterales bacterium]
MKTIELRKLFLKYFQDRGHEIVPSSPLVPGNDPTLLFTNSGMVQFKDVFLGTDKRAYSRAVTAQRCVRAGGKHNDLENVGYTARHHTFFEMLGNFSFGDYFKRDAIHLAWDFLTGDIGLPEDRLWVTVYVDDDEAADVWQNEIGIPSQRFRRIATSDNFWAMGDTGPCGPCSEIFYDHGPEIEGGPPGSPEQDGDRYVELWNLVFMQYERTADGTLKPLPRPSVDTGMGLERIAAVLQKVYSNYDIDLFQALVEHAAQVVGTTDLASKSLRVLADHIRSAAFLITDGVTPSNEGRGYVLRRIVRRAIRHGYQLGCKQPFLHLLTSSVVEQMGDAYPELRHAQSKVERVLLTEGERFTRTLDQGLKILDREVGMLSGSELPGEVAFRLYDTYGFPLDLTADYLREQGLTVDSDGFEKSMQGQRERAKSASKFESIASEGPSVSVDVEFCGYQTLREGSTIAAILVGNSQVDAAEEEDEAIFVLRATPFYAESGGQVGDTGVIQSNGSSFNVEDTQYVSKGVIGHVGTVVKGSFATDDRVTAKVDSESRISTMKNHSATHLLHAALQEVLGTHVQQKGSLVAPDRLRFDFSHDCAVTDDEIRQIETLVNEQIRENWLVSSQVMDLEDAKARGAAALFGEKYDSQVRVIEMGDYSLELCGGTHVERTGDIGLFKVVQESSIASGIRRIEAFTGCIAVERMQNESQKLSEIARKLNIGVNDVEDKLTQIMDSNRSYERQVSELKMQLATGGGAQSSLPVTTVDGVKLIVSRQDGVEPKDLRNILFRMQDNLGTGVVVLGSVNDDKATLLCSVSKDLTDRVNAGQVIAKISPLVDGKGGGKAHLAQGGGSRGDNIDQALAAVPQAIA